MHFELSIVNGKSVFDIVRAHRCECIDRQDAYLRARGRTVPSTPNSYFFAVPDKPDCRIIALPAYLGNNFRRGRIEVDCQLSGQHPARLSRASAVLVLNNYERLSFAILESSIISAARTAAQPLLRALV